MRWRLAGLLVVAGVLFQPWVSSHGAFDARLVVSRLAGLALLGIAFGLWIIRTLRSKAYNGWHPIFRLMFLGVVGTFVGLTVVGMLFSVASSPSEREPRPFSIGVAGAAVVRFLLNAVR